MNENQLDDFLGEMCKARRHDFDRLIDDLSTAIEDQCLRLSGMNKILFYRASGNRQLTFWCRVKDSSSHMSCCNQNRFWLN